MTTPDMEARALLIKKLLNKAEAAGATDQERDAYNAKATQLMLQWSIDEAMITDADRLIIEKIIKVTFQSDAPKSYSHEVTSIGIEVAKAFNCRGFLQKSWDNSRTNLTVVGFEKDVERVRELWVSLSRQAKLAMASSYCEQPWGPYHTGSDKFNWKRSFLTGFAWAVGGKLAEVKRATVNEAETATPGTELVLVARVAQVDSYIEDNMTIGKGRPRRHNLDGAHSGLIAGRKADIGGTQVTS